ncbi:transposase [Deinococcus metallilatus]|uniref:IS200/IS605 family element transposase accessory protein TnpB n=1 Tax=Deinococcus metallilatus TaxID=1211322 RepID=A0AAJ5F5E5_9DEIO|nr:transposase [Deinococcus metallilatus]RXJ09562.1 transposase [Deinococcus metallilatus]TLK28937.1 IS200/IS605 family element transposase accessory protein TnpB [Deinococcus metallilatus]
MANTRRGVTHIENITLKAFKYRLYPTKAQESALDTTLILCQRLYNGMLEERRGAYKKAGKSLTAYDQMKSLPEVKAALPEYAGVNAQVLQDVAKRLDKSFKGFFRRIKAGQKAGYPRFRGRDRYDSFTYPQPSQNSVIGDGKHVYLPKIGNVRIRLHRPCAGKLKTLAVKREGREWYVVLTCEVPRAEPLPATGSEVGIDVGTTWFYTTSDGEFCENHRFFQRSSRKLRVAQRSLARKPNKRSNRRKKAKERVAKLCRKTARSRLQLHHEEAKKLITNHDLICHEDLNVKGMAQGNLSKQIHDVGWGQFFQILSSKAAEAGRRVIAVDPRFTSQRCRICGHTEKGNRASQANFRCLSCGHSENADVNAAKNILAQGLRFVAQRTSQEDACHEKPQPAGLG